MTTIDSLTHLSDEQLLARLRTLAGDERRAMVASIAALAELDARRLYLRQGCSSLFTYCTQALHLSEHAAYGRIEAARAARRFPMLCRRRCESCHRQGQHARYRRQRTGVRVRRRPINRVR